MAKIKQWHIPIICISAKHENGKAIITWSFVLKKYQLKRRSRNKKEKEMVQSCGQEATIEIKVYKFKF